MIYLHARPSELEDHGECRVVDELCPAVRVLAGDAGHEDEGKAYQDGDEANHVPRLFLTILPVEIDKIYSELYPIFPAPAEYEWIWSVRQSPNYRRADAIRQLAHQQNQTRVVIVKI